VVDRARLEIEAGQRHQTIPTWLKAQEISDLILTFQNYRLVCVRKPRCFSRSWTRRITFLSQLTRPL